MRRLFNTSQFDAKFIIFVERLPKWSVLRRSESNPTLFPGPSSTFSSELLNPTLQNPPVGNEWSNGMPSFPRDSPQTPPVSVFGRRHSWLTSCVARPTVLKHRPILSSDLEATSSNGSHPLKRLFLKENYS